jgi:uncharacterized protein (TIGR02466 family)
MNKRILEAIFSESLYFTNIKADHNKFYKALSNLEMYDVLVPDPLLDESKRNKLSTGNHISYNKKILQTKQFKTLKNILYKEIKIAIQDFFQYDIDFTIETSWGTMSEPNAFSEFHTHANYWYSAVYYPHGSYEDNMSIIFNKTLSSFFDVPIKKYKHHNQNQRVLRVLQGDLIVFPSVLKHKIGFNFTKQNRYSLALNILPKGNIGRGDGSRKL